MKSRIKTLRKVLAKRLVECQFGSDYWLLQSELKFLEGNLHASWFILFILESRK